jgi:hypothetical protein
VDGAPLWLQHLLLLIALPLAIEAGYRLHAAMAKTATYTDLGRDEWGHITGASMSILGLLIAFTVSMAVGHYESRRQLVVDEANAISTTYLRAQLFDDPARGQLGSLISGYARDRQLVFDAGDNHALVDRAQAVTEANQGLLWSATIAALRQPGAAGWSTTFLPAMNGMFDLAATLQASLEAGVPARVVRVVIIYAFVTAGLARFPLGAGGGRRRAGLMLVFLMVAVTIGLIIDLDNPRSGGIQVPEAPLQRTTAAIAKAEDARLKALAAPQIRPEVK